MPAELSRLHPATWLPTPGRQRALLLLALVAYGVSLPSPAFMCQYGRSFLGYEVLAMGWVGPIALDPRWYANPIAIWLACSAWFGWRGRFAALGAVIVLVLAAASVLPAMGCGGDPASAAMSLGPGVGAYLWITALALVALCALAQGGRSEAAKPLPAPVVRPVDSAAQAALADFRAGRAARARCPDCRALILLKAARDGASPGSLRVTMACACGACDGKFEMPDRPIQAGPQAG